MITPGESLRYFADLTDLHPEWTIFACLVSRDGLAYKVFAERGEPLDTARALATTIVVDQEEARMAQDESATDGIED